MAYDETGGGNAVYSKEYVNKFDLYAYIDTSALNTSQRQTQSEATDLWHLARPTHSLARRIRRAGWRNEWANGSTGIGWLIQRVEAPTTAGRRRCCSSST